MRQANTVVSALINIISNMIPKENDIRDAGSCSVLVGRNFGGISLSKDIMVSYCTIVVAIDSFPGAHGSTIQNILVATVARHVYNTLILANRFSF